MTDDLFDEIQNILYPQKKGSTGTEKTQVRPPPTSSYPEPFKMSFGVTIRFYPNGEAYVESTWPLGKAKVIKKKPKKPFKAKRVNKAPVKITKNEVY